MNKAEFINKMHSYNPQETNKVQTERAFNAFVDAMNEALAEGQSVTLTGFGTFSVAQRAARQGRNPRTSAVINIPTSNTIKFKPGKALKGTVR